MKTNKLLVFPLIGMLLTGCNPGAKIRVPENVTKLANLTYAMTIRDDNTAAFFDNGGASNDTEMVQYIQNTVFADPSIDDSCLSYLVTQFGCSSFIYKTPKGEVFLARNFDYHQNEPVVLVHNIPQSGYESLSMVPTEFMGLLTDEDVSAHTAIMKTAEFYPLDGINSQGVALNCNIIYNEHSHVNQTAANKVNLLQTTMIRKVLNNAKSVDEAISIITNSNMHDSLSNVAFHFQIIDKDYNSAVVEFYDNEIQIIRKQQSDKTQIMCNDELNSKVGADYQSQPRYQTCLNAVNAKPNGMEISEALTTLTNARIDGINQYALVYNVSALSIDFYKTPNFGTIFHYDL